MSEFVECATCAAKPGSPALCASCVSNRRLIYKLQNIVDYRDKRNCTTLLSLTKKEFDRLHEIADELDQRSQWVLLQALRLYDAVHSGDAEIVHTTIPPGCPDLGD